MALSPQTRLGPYEIVCPLGAGGMGEVYRARDTRLGRDVAIKVLPAHLSGDPELKARFEREAKAVSSLNHPHICTLHDVGHQDGTDYLVMEYLEGESLHDRLKKGALPLPQALRYGIEIADALDKAHRQGVVHRDLKPGNIMLTKSGAKLLDFGLAKTASASGAGGLMSTFPTQEHPLTEKGTVLGTFQYMSPEQLEGKDADARTDIFAFGAVLYEMLTGKRACEGKSQASLISAILKDEPQPITTLQPLTPPSLERVVRKCLAKDPEERWDTAHDLADELRWIATGGSGSSTSLAPSAVRKRSNSFAWGAAALSALVALALAVNTFTPRAPAARARIVSSILAPEKNVFGTLNGPMALSQDGRQLAFAARDASGRTLLWVRALDSGEARALAGTENASNPFWFPDARFLGFFAEGKLKRIEAAGGTPEVLAQAPFPGGGTWAPDGTILFSGFFASSLMRIAPGRDPTPVDERPPGTTDHRWPLFLADGRRFLYTVVSQVGGSDGIYLRSLDSAVPPRLVVPAVSNAAYVDPGILLYWRDGAVRAQSLDAKTFEPRGEAVRVAENVIFHADRTCGLFSASPSGLLVYQTGGSTSASELLWVDRSGRALGSIAPPAFYYSPRLSLDGRRVAVDVSDTVRNNGDIWIFDLHRRVSSRVTYDPANETAPIWSPDDTQLVFGRDPDLYRIDLVGAGKDERLLASPGRNRPQSWSADGRHVLFHSLASVASSEDIWVLSLPDGKAKPWLATAFNEAGPQFSPDARWVAYSSDESGRSEVYVRSFPEPSQKVLVSAGGGTAPMWRRDGRELFYFSADRKIMAMPVKISLRFEAETPRPLFDAPLRSVAVRFIAQYDVSADGQRFLLNRMVAEEGAGPMTLLQNSTAALGRPSGSQ